MRCPSLRVALPVLFKVSGYPSRRRRPCVDDLIVMERDREQADLPTEQPPSGKDPRLPATDAYPRWPRHPVRSSP
jgi:hypothetical protein